VQERILATRRQTLGEGHPDTLTSIANLAATLHAEGDLAGARVLQEEALSALRHVVGGEVGRTHPDPIEPVVRSRPIPA
jgi:hypothetical protein